MVHFIPFVFEKEKIVGSNFILTTGKIFHANYKYMPVVSCTYHMSLFVLLDMEKTLLYIHR